MPQLDIDTITQAATDPAEVKADDLSVKAQPIADVIAADRYAATREAAGKRGGGLKITRMRMPGARGREPGC